MSREDILSYEEKFGPSAAADFLLLVGPDDFEGTYEEYNCLMDKLQCSI